MSKSYLLAGFAGRGIYWGLVFGSILNVVYNLLLFQFSVSLFLLFYAIEGAVIGVLVGGVNGLMLGLLSLAFFQSNINEQKYRLAVLIATIAFVLTTSTIIFNGIASFYAVTPDYSVILLVLLPAIMAAFAAAYASQAMATWYIAQQQKRSPQNL